MLHTGCSVKIGTFCPNVEEEPPVTKGRGPEDAFVVFNGETIIIIIRLYIYDIH